MRTFLKLSSLALTAGLMLAIGCGGDDDGGTGSSSDSGGSGGSGGSSSSGGSGGSSSTSKSTSSSSSGGSSSTSKSTSSTSAGGSSGSGGAPAEAPYSNDDVLADDGPNSKVTGSGTGAFVEEDDWLDGWTNWSTDSDEDADCSGDLADLPIEDDGTLSDDDTTLTAEDGPYLLEQKMYVADGQTLTIEPGTVFCGTTDGSLIVSRGGMIDAQGTKSKPIIFTSAADQGDKHEGDWGGVILLGKAKNFKGEDVLIEGVDDVEANRYGGTDDKDNSGIMTYVRIEFGGTEIGPGNEINGLTFGSIGSGTTINHIQVNTTYDDCYEWFGGTVKVDHMVCNNGGDDMFDGDQGFRGTIDTAFGRQVKPLSSDPNGFEMDSDLGGNTPTSNIKAMNVTLAGTGKDEEVLGYGMVLRENLTGAFSNLVISGFAAGVDTRDDFGSQSDPNVTIKDSMMFENVVHTIAYNENKEDCAEDDDDPTCDDDMGFDERKWFEDGDGDMTY